MADWNNFTAFAAPAQLDKNAILTVANPPDLGQDQARFTNWVNNLRGHVQNDANHCGIPAAFANDVHTLLEQFFPNGRLPVYVRYNAPAVPGGLYTANPVNVQFGAAHQQIPINDGPTALAYIFSVATPTVANPIYSNYALPLLVLFSRCLHLAYASAGALGNVNTTNVPFMSCTMYGLNAHPAIILGMLGSAYVTDAAVPGGTQAEKNGVRRMMNTWRRESVVDGVIQPVLPPLAPVRTSETCKAYSRMVKGTGIAAQGATLTIPGGHEAFNSNNPLVPVDVAQGIFNSLQLASSVAWGNQIPAQVVTGLNRNQLETHKVLGPQMILLLRPIIQCRWQAGYNRTDAATLALMQQYFTAFFNFFYTPHMFPNPNPNPNQAEVAMWPPGVPPVVNANLAALWANYGARALDWLDYLYTWVTTDDDNLAVAGPGTQIYGRCAETHPAVGILPQYFPARAIPPANPPTPVHGFSIEPRVLTGVKSGLLNANFSQATLNTIHEATNGNPRGILYRLPCDNCKTLLPAFDIPMGPIFYYTDLYAADPADAPNVV
ncbi:hypothetical protein MMC11_008964 [Xylographa trunciseda]|nr:hypothetical protein [Xylographa trunciseda]